jgi:hypothetical protein
MIIGPCRRRLKRVSGHERPDRRAARAGPDESEEVRVSTASPEIFSWPLRGAVVAARDPAGEWAVTRRRLTWPAFLSCCFIVLCVVCVAREGRVLTGSGGRCRSGVRGAASDGTAARRARAWLLLLRSSSGSGYLGHCL